MFFSGCSNHVEPKGYTKTFEAEDRYIVFALQAEKDKNNEIASQLFDTLYEKSHKKEYLYRSLTNLLVAKKYKKMLEVIKNNDNDLSLKRLEIVALINLFKMQEAESKVLALVQESKEAQDYLLVSDLYVAQKKFDKAVKYLESAYVKNYNEKILDRMSIILYVNLKRKKEAIAQLETHSRIYSCSKLICNRLISFYSDQNNIDGLLSAYLRYYKVDKRYEVAQKIIQIYNYKKEYIKLIDFLKENDVENELLLRLYLQIKNYKKAYVLAKAIYEETEDIDYLAKSAIYEYESLTKVDKKSIRGVIEKFKKVIKNNPSPLYLNYYGYLLIDHDIDIKKGIGYIKKALLIKPNAPYYLDSLAWGYYKLHRCKKAKKIMNKIITLDGGDNQEILSHIKKIDKCINKKGK
jgi:predicted Zn-dependent protease